MQSVISPSVASCGPVAVISFIQRKKLRRWPWKWRCSGQQALTAGLDNIHFHTLPGDGTGYYNGGSYYILYDDQVLSLVNDYFNPYTEARVLADLNVFVPEGYKRPNS